jgi:hypothetical protein
MGLGDAQSYREASWWRRTRSGSSESEMEERQSEWWRKK